MDERRVEAGRHRSTVGVLSGLCSVLAVTVLAGGVAMFNNYQKMHQMESVIASVIPEGNIKDGLMAFAGRGGTENPSGKGWSAADQPDYVIEEGRLDQQGLERHQYGKHHHFRKQLGQSNGRCSRLRQYHVQQQWGHHCGRKLHQGFQRSPALLRNVQRIDMLARLAHGALAGIEAATVSHRDITKE